jgi:hypothetical protein
VEQEAGGAEAGAEAAGSCCCSGEEGGGGRGEGGGGAVTGGAGAGIAGHVGGRESPLKAGVRGGLQAAESGETSAALWSGGGRTTGGEGGECECECECEAREQDETRETRPSRAEPSASRRWGGGGGGRAGEEEKRLEEGRLTKAYGWAANAGSGVLKLKLAGPAEQTSYLDLTSLKNGKFAQNLNPTN